MLKPYGVITPIITPVDHKEQVDEAALRQVVRYMLQSGVTGIFALGSTGEFWAFSFEEKRRIMEIVVNEVGGRVPTYAGTMAESTRETVTLTHMAEETNADAVVVLTPYYISPGPRELYDHYATLAATTSLPLIIYNNPKRTGVRISPEIVSQLAQIENIVAIKDSSGDTLLTQEYIQAVPEDFTVLMGIDNLILQGLQLGCKGTVAATANVVPKLVLEIYNCFLSGDMAGAQAAQDRLSPLRKAFNDFGTFPSVIKEAVSLIGIQSGPTCKPVGEMTSDSRAQLVQVLKNIGALK